MRWRIPWPCIAAALLASACAPPGSEEAVRLDRARLLVSMAERPPADDAPGWQAETLPDRWNRARRLQANQGWYRLELELPRVPDELQGVLLRRAALNAMVYVNGSLVGQGGRFEPPMARNVFHATYASVPVDLLRVGTNRIDVRLGMTYGSLGLLDPVWVGPDRVLRQVFERSQFLTRTVTIIAHGISVMVASFSILLALRGRQGHPGTALLSSGLLCFSLGSLPVLIPELPVPSRLAEWASWSLLILAVGLAGMGLRRGVGRRSRFHDVAAVATAVVSSALLATVPYRDFLPALVLALVPTALLVIDAGVSSVRALSQGVLWPRTPLVIIGALVLVFPPLELLTGPPRTLALAATDLNTPITALCLAWFLFGRMLRTVVEAQRLDAELAAQRARAALERDRAIARERDRIVRDMHDGTAGHLASALSMVRAGARDPEALTTVLQDALDDLRSTIAALDPAETTLGGVLGVLRDPLERRLRQHDMRLDWHVGDVDHVRALDAADAGHLLRVIQEAVGNAARHAGASRVEVRAERAPDGDAVVLSVTDDGRGGVRPRPGGRGLANLERRAESLGASLSIQSGEGGTRVALCLPAARPEAGSGATPRS